MKSDPYLLIMTETPKGLSKHEIEAGGKEVTLLVYLCLYIRGGEIPIQQSWKVTSPRDKDQNYQFAFGNHYLNTRTTERLGK